MAVNLQKEQNVKNPSIEDLILWFILRQSMSQKKIQKLCYYAQAWSLVFLDKDIINGIKFQAWVHGPVNLEIRKHLIRFGWNNIEVSDEYYKIYNKTKKALVKDIDSKFSASQLDVLNQVYNVYAKFDANQLEIFTHKELPWKEKREGLEVLQPGKRIISNKTMKTFYRGMLKNAE